MTRFVENQQSLCTFLDQIDLEVMHCFGALSRARLSLRQLFPRGELPAHLQRSFLRDRAGIPGYGPGTDLSKEWIEITVPPMVLFDDGKSRLGASFMAGID
jgi:hypothetical protein